MSQKLSREWTGFLPKRSVVMKRRNKAALPGSDGPRKRSDAGRVDPSLANISTSVLEKTASKSQNQGGARVHATQKQENEILSHLWKNDENLSKLANELSGCTRCKLSKKRTRIVMGEGNPRAKLLFVGEAPGEQEDLHGRPFVGRAGQLLDKMIGALGLTREDVFIANVVKCRPPENRNPEPDEISSCSPFLKRQLKIISPKVIVALGKFSSQTLLETETRISELRGKIHPMPKAMDLESTVIIPTFHPAYLLRNPSAKKEAWEDLQLAAKTIGIKVPKGK